MTTKADPFAIEAPALISFSGDFMPITEARIVYTPNPSLLWQGDVILINRARAELYWPAPREKEA